MHPPRIIWRYIFLDVLLHTLIGLGAVTLLLLVQNLLRFLDDLVSVGVGFGTLWQLIAVILPSYLGYAIPAGLLFGILLSFGRMSSDGEVVAIRASGISIRGLLPPVLALAAVAALITGHMLWNMEPESRLRMRTLVRELAKAQRFVQPGRFLKLGDRVLYVHERGDEACPLRGVLVSDFSDQERSVYISAQCGAIIQPPEGSDVYTVKLDFTEGSIHMEDTDESRYRRILFAKMETSLDLSALKLRKGPRESTFAELLALQREYAAGDPPVPLDDEERILVETQIQRRVSFPLASVLLAIVAVPLGIRPLRSGRSAGALTAIGLMAAYWCLFAAGEASAEAGYAPPWIALWTPNLILLLVGGWLLRRTTYGDS